MEEKGLLGADLVFDLDADHLPGGKSLSYPEMLEAVKRGIVKLWDRFLQTELGFDEKRMRIVFSGGRGYHIHGFDERGLGLGSHEGLGLAGFLTAQGRHPQFYFRTIPFLKTQFTRSVLVHELFNE